jgi:hypothetical protein
MLAPRKKLWSTPKEAIIEAIKLLRPGRDDTVIELGFGDGEFIFQCANLDVNDEYDNPLHNTGIQMMVENPLVGRILGIEIEQDRVDALRTKLSDANLLSERIQLICGNVLEQDISAGTCFFFYFIPRGLRLILPMLRRITHNIRVASFMNPLPGLEPTSVHMISPKTHMEAQWPLYFYELRPRPVLDESLEFLAHTVSTTRRF